MKKLIIECETCRYQMNIEAEEPTKGFDYLTNANRNCRTCGNKLKFTEPQTSHNNDFKKVCPMCNDTGIMDDLVNGKMMKVPCERCSGKPVQKS